MFGAGKNMHRVYGVGLYLLVVMFLYGKKEVLPKSIIKAFSNPEVKGSLKYKKKVDPKEAIDYRNSLATQFKVTEAGASGGRSMYAAGKDQKQKQKGT